MNLFRWLFISLSWLFSGSGIAADYGFQVKSAELVREQDKYVLNADIDYRFSERAIEGLKHGVPLTLVVAVKVYRSRALIWDERVVSVMLRYRIRYHALAKVYQILNDSSGVQRNFVSLSDAVDALGRIRGMSIIEAERLNPDDQYEVSIKADLDIEALPLPLRPVAYVTPQWYLGSSWYTWPLEK
jgi:Domain of unknown function (DUF4390)